VNYAEIIQTVANVATAMGILLATWQIAESRRRGQSQFEDRLVEQYRALTQRIPLGALVGDPLPDEESRQTLRAFYEYFDLCNAQALLAARGRLRKETWANWKEGIDQHMARPAFQAAWNTLSPKLGGSFDEFVRLLQPNNHAQSRGNLTRHDSVGKTE
jgi:hypothetical protein